MGSPKALTLGLRGMLSSFSPCVAQDAPSSSSNAPKLLHQTSLLLGVPNPRWSQGTSRVTASPIPGHCWQQRSVSRGAKGCQGDGRAGAQKCQAGLGGLLGKESELPPAHSGHLKEGFRVIRFVFQSGNSLWLECEAGTTYVLGFLRMVLFQPQKAQACAGRPCGGAQTPAHTLQMWPPYLCMAFFSLSPPSAFTVTSFVYYCHLDLTSPRLEASC